MIHRIAVGAVIVINPHTGVRCENFYNTPDAERWIAGLGVSPEYKALNYKIVNAVEYWRRHGYEVEAI